MAALLGIITHCHCFLSLAAHHSSFSITTFVYRYRMQEELLAYHPGLAFLESTPEFQEKYARTVIARMFYTCDPLCNRVIDVRSLRTSNVLSAFQLVDVEEDINLVTDYFSYEHFYVLYCKVGGVVCGAVRS